MVIDVHAQIGTFGSQSTTPAALAEYAVAVGCERILFGNIDAASSRGARNLNETDANLAALAAAAEHGVLAPLYWLRPGRPDSNPTAFAGALATEPFAGAVLAPRLNSFSIDDPRLDEWMKAAARMSCPVLVLCDDDERSRPQRVLTLSRRHPKVRFVLSDFTGEMPWHDALEAAGSESGRGGPPIMLTTARRSREEIKAAISAIGAEKLVFGTNALVGGGDHAKSARAMIDTIRSLLDAAKAERVLGGSAAKLFSHAAAPAAG